MWRYATVVRFVVMLAVGLGCPQPTPPTPAARGPGPNFIRGFVVAAVVPEKSTSARKEREIYLPGARVSLLERGTNKAVTSDVSDLSGRFTLKIRTPGGYRICVTAEGFKDNCGEQVLELGARSAYAGKLRVVPAHDSAATAFGRVSLRDGKRPRMLQPLLGTNAFARVELEDAGTVRHSAYVNNYGEYVVPAVPVGAPFVLRAKIDNGKVELAVDPQTGVIAGRAYRFDLQLDNTAPKLPPIVPRDLSGKPVEFAGPGATIDLTGRAEDRDGDQLSYRWLLTPGNGALNVTGQPSVRWKLPGKNGRYAVTLVVSDDKGGYADSYFSFRVSTGGVRFSGRVVDVAGAPVGRAQVEVNGRSVNANPTGWFQLEVPPADRYVMNTRKAGFGLASQIHPLGTTDLTVTLTRAETSTADPSVPITLQQRRTKEDCPGPRGRRLPWDVYLKPGLIQWQDGAGNALSLAELSKRKLGEVKSVLPLFARVHPQLAHLASQITQVDSVSPGRQTECGPGIAVEIPANALADRNGNPPAGKVEVSLSTFDIGSPLQLPGDYSSLDLNGRSRVMESYGAGDIKIMAGSTAYGLKPNTTAKVRLPVDPGQLASGVSLPPTIPLLYYDERRGVWVEEGTWQLVGSGSNRAYETRARHFSTLNADLQKSGQSCVEVRSGPGMPASYTVEVTLPPRTAGAAPTVRSFSISDPTNVIYNLPNNVNIVLVPIVAGTKPDGSSGDVPAGVFVVNTGGPQTAVTNLPPGPPYYNTDANGNPIGPCLTRVDLANLAIQDAPDPPYEFLQGLDVQATDLTELDLSDPTLATAIRGASNDYLSRIDPRGRRQDLIDFKNYNNFGQPLNTANGEIEESAVYANSGDLGFGRSMHCRRSRANDGKFDIACYVTNYGDHTTPDAQDAADAASSNAAAEVATVAMEYTRVENPVDPADPTAPEFPDDVRTVKFYVYKLAKPSPTNTGQGNGRDISANLDGAGERPVPQLCNVCHGGAYASEPVDPTNPAGPRKPAFDNRSDAFMSSRFLPFDLHYFTSPPAPNTVTAQHPAFRTLNLEIVKKVPDGAPASDPVVELIDELHPPGSAPTDPQVANAVVPNWDKANPASADHVFYRDVFARACRTCHITSPFGNIVMNDKAEFRSIISTVQTRVCDQHVMPHARRTHDLFWTSLGPNMAGQFQMHGQVISGWDPSTPAAQCGLSYTPGGNPPSSAFTAEIQPIFTGRCATCHGAATSSNANLALSAGNAYPDLFNGSTPVVSTEHPPTPRIDPTASSNSYLYLKVEQQANYGLPGAFVSPGPGCRMPRNCSTAGTFLDARDADNDGTNDMEEIRRWIDLLGAPGP